jgi:tRNA G18 (ribose-2'-O)-methylase SpoU
MRVKKITELNRLSVEEFRERPKIPLIVVLDNVRSLNNIGSVFRSSDAFLVDSVYLCGITATPPNVEIHKTALGAEDSMKWEYFENTEQAVARLRNQGYIICAIEQAEDSVMLDDLLLDATRKYAVILGNEVKGVQQKVVDLCDHCIEIPQYGTKHSLNISVAAGIIIWEFSRQLK